MENGLRSSNIERIEEFEFFDGVGLKRVNYSYDNWFSSLDFSVYKKSFVQKNCIKIRIFSGKGIGLIEGDLFTADTLEGISKKFNLSIKKSYGKKKCTYKGHLSEEFIFIHDKDFYVIYSLGGSKSIESIYIHGLWKNCDTEKPLRFV